MEIRYLDLKEISPEVYTSLWEYDRVIQLEEPTFIKFSPKDTIIQFWQGPYWDSGSESWKEDYTNMEVFYNSDIIRDEIKTRCYIPIEIPYSADVSYYIASKYGTDFIVFVPNSNIQKRSELDSVFRHLLSDLITNRNIKSKVEGNDVFYEKDGMFKKFSGSIYRPASNEYGYVDNGITYKFNSELANRLRRVKTDGINIKKFEVDDISDAVGGLWEVDPTIDRDKLDFEVVQEMSNHLGYTIRHDILTNKEEDLLFERGHRRMTEKEWYLYGNKDKFDIY